MHGLAAGRDDAGFEAHHLSLAGFVLRFARGFFNRHMVCVDKHAIATQHGHFAHLGHRRQTTGQLADDFFFVATQAVNVHLGLAKVYAHGRQVAHLVHDGRHMQQGFGGNTTHVQTHATQLGVTLDERDFEAKVSCTKRCAVAARPAA